MAKRLFIIDDDEDILEILSIVFEDEGYNVVTANNSDAANYILELSPDLILLDVRIAGSPKSGLQICQELKSRQTTCNIPIILISAEHNLALLASNCHADSYVNKPFEITDLLQTVAQYV
ncbi:response regulator [Mucilaginibacter robiniae]|uniref:Response regulator n=1 Tax=Mucilaginibacter robiniae TaxID=2728022 RepID=A0A7L5E8W1_9SPHI|nr:response regulator [Mucilaginibacter robiniae]QJD96816.1 response regulator [Mucilaginibacter robiniae]